MLREPGPQPELPARSADEVAEELRRRLLSGLHLGTLKLGARLPSLRVLARELGVDVRSVRRAYQTLEREGLVELRARSGIYFAPAAERARRPLSPHSQWLINVALDGLNRSIALPDLAERVASHVRSRHIRVACVECNDDQGIALCGVLGSAFGFESMSRDVDRLLQNARPGEALPGVDLLVTTPYHAGEIEELAGKVGLPWVSVESRSNVFTEIAAQLEHGPVYYVVGDARFAKKVGKIFANNPCGDRLHVLVAGRDDAFDAPASAPCYVTQLARDRLDGRVPPHARPSTCMLIAPASSRELVRFIVAHNLERLGADA